MNQLHIIDTLGVFVEPSDHDTINWSKVDFVNLETAGRLNRKTRKRITTRFEHYIVTVKKIGYNSLSFDDVAHLVAVDWYEPDLKQLLDDYHLLYRELFAIADAHDMKVFVNSDYLFTNDTIRTYIEKNNLTVEDFFEQVMRELITNYTTINGVILRIGENDGKDVDSPFLSKLFIRTPATANRLLARIIPLFEQNDRILISRTWTVGVYKVGDLIWNESTYDEVFKDIDSSSLVVSMKFGDTDFMRGLALNPLLHSTKHNKIIELQTRREWEGMGMYPSFVGWDYAAYLQQLENNPSVIGTHIWCQTGGWAKKEWSNVTFLDNSSFWNELNTFVTARISIHRQTVEQAITLFCNERKIKNVEAFSELLKLSEIAVNNGIYIPEFATRSYYFRRSRVPTLFWITWDTPLLQPVAMTILRTMLAHPLRAIEQSREAVSAARDMLTIARQIQLPDAVIHSLQMHVATLELFVYLKSYVLGCLSADDFDTLLAMKRKYIEQYPEGYTIPEVKPPSSSSRYGRAASRRSVRQIFRTSAGYRKRDKIILASSPVQRRLVAAYMRLSRSKLADQSMGIDSLFK